MPKVGQIKHDELHTTRKSGPVAKIEFVDHLRSIKVGVIGAPTVEQFREMISVFMMNTWSDRLQTEFKDVDIDTCIKELFAGNILPTGMETINLTFTVEGMNLVDTTHLIRHRLGSFSAQTHADRDMRDDRVLVPAGIIANSDIAIKFHNLIRDSIDLYTEMMDSVEVNCLDARLVMPRCFDHFYIARFTIKDLIAFCRMRGDEQIQTQADNIIAMSLWLEVLKIYPFLAGWVDFEAEDKFYIKQCKEGKTNIFPPNDKNDCFDWSESQFVHNKHRDEFPGGETYLILRAELLKEIKSYGQTI